MKTNEYKILIKEHHLDTFGHVNNAVYLELYEEARWEIIVANGFGIQDIAKWRVGPVILEVHLKFLKEIQNREVITIHTQMPEYTHKIGSIQQWMTNNQNQICSEAHFKIGLFDLNSRKLIPPTPEWLKAIGLNS